MLIYTKALDPYHAILRMLAIVLAENYQSLERDKLRILDFLMAFPEYIAAMSLPHDLTFYRKIFKKKNSAYRDESSYVKVDTPSLGVRPLKFDRRTITER